MSGGFGRSGRARRHRARARAGLDPIKVNAVVQRGVNDQHCLPLVERFRGTGVIVRFIEYMDVGNPQRLAPGGGALGENSPRASARAGRCTRCRGATTAARSPSATLRRRQGEVGFISSVSQPFCGDCSRARLSSSDGSLFTRLFATTGRRPARGPLRAGATDAELAAHDDRAVWTPATDRPQRAARRAAEAAAPPRSRCTYRRLNGQARRQAQPATGALRHLGDAGDPRMVDVGDKARRWSTSGRGGARPPRRSCPAARLVARALAATGHRTRRSGVRHGDHRRRAGSEAHARADPVLPSAADRSLRGRHRRASAAARWWCAAPSACSTDRRRDGALTGAVGAALTIYDMCKALSHDITIDPRRATARQAWRPARLRPHRVAVAWRGRRRRPPPPRGRR